MKVRCTKLLDSMGQPTDHSPWVKLGGTYHVLSVEVERTGSRFRLVGEEPTPALFELDMFELVSSVLPSSWVVTSPEPGVFVLGPAQWGRPGFWDAYFDRDPEAVSCFESERSRIVSSDP